MKLSRKARHWPFAQFRNRGWSSGGAETLKYPRTSVSKYNSDKLHFDHSHTTIRVDRRFRHLGFRWGQREGEYVFRSQDQSTLKSLFFSVGRKRRSTNSRIKTFKKRQFDSPLPASAIHQSALNLTFEPIRQIRLQ